MDNMTTVHHHIPDDDLSDISFNPVTLIISYLMTEPELLNHLRPGDEIRIGDHEIHVSRVDRYPRMTYTILTEDLVELNTNDVNNLLYRLVIGKTHLLFNEFRPEIIWIHKCRSGI